MKIAGTFKPIYVDFEAGLLQLESITPEDENGIVEVCAPRSYINIRDPLIRRWTYDRGGTYRVTVEEIENAEME